MPKESFGLIVIVMIVLNIVFFPRQEKIAHENEPPYVPDSFSVVVEGAVVFPGTYVFYRPTSEQDIIDYAGGYLDEADMGSVSNRIFDSDGRIHVASEDETSNEPTIKVDVNQANFKELLEIPSMTETRAASLIIYREANGDFMTIDDLINVKHIGPVTLENIRPHITVG